MSEFARTVWYSVRMLKKLMLLLSLPFGCTVRDVPPPRPERADISQIRGSGWSMSVPMNYALEVTPGSPQRTTTCVYELAAKSDKVVIIVSVCKNTVKSEKEYSMLAARAFLDQKGGHIAITFDEVNINEHPATMATALIDTMVMGQIAVASGKRGYIIQCGGMAEHVKDVMAACSELVKTFRLVSELN